MASAYSSMRHIDVVVNSAGPWSTVRVEQPFLALASLGCDVRFVATPLIRRARFAMVPWWFGRGHYLLQLTLGKQ